MPRIPHTSPQTLQLFEALLDDPQRWRYGYDLSRETALASGTLYPILMRLTDQRLLETGWEPSDEPGRPPRH
ncbi:PadR family transcriptional regulator, partial [Winogradskya humida]